MARWIRILVALGLIAGSPLAAEAQVFKPKASKKASAPTKSAKKAPAKKAASKKAAPKRSKKNAAAERGRPDDLTPEPATREDQDFVRITDDDEIE